MTELPRPKLVGATAIILLVSVVSCTNDGRDQRPWHEDTLPTVTISLPDSTAARLEMDSARWVNAPPIRYAAIIQPDPDHTVPVLVTGSEAARLTSIRVGGSVHRGDTLALIREVAGAATTRPLLATSAEVWWPRRRTGEVVSPGDTVGEIQHPGRFIAVGQIDEAEARSLELGDHAVIPLPGRPPVSVNGRVGAITSARYRVEVAVHFHSNESPPAPGTLTQVSIFPSGTRGRVLVVPATSIADLPQGPALFMAKEGGVFEVRFVASDEHEGGARVVHQGLDGPVAIAVGDLSVLITAAKDSFQARSRARP